MNEGFLAAYRPQLLSLFIDDLMREDGAVRLAANQTGDAA